MTNLTKKHRKLAREMLTAADPSDGGLTDAELVGVVAQGLAIGEKQERDRIIAIAEKRAADFRSCHAYEQARALRELIDVIKKRKR